MKKLYYVEQVEYEDDECNAIRNAWNDAVDGIYTDMEEARKAARKAYLSYRYFHDETYGINLGKVEFLKEDLNFPKEEDLKNLNLDTFFNEMEGLNDSIYDEYFMETVEEFNHLSVFD